MEKAAALAVFESLASGTRLDVFRLLVRTGTDGMVAGEIAAALEVPANSLSFHLKALTHAGLLSVEPQGRFLRLDRQQAGVGQGLAVEGQAVGRHIEGGGDLAGHHAVRKRSYSA